jgi:YggT family protein
VITLLLQLVDTVVQLFIWALIISSILSLLVSFNMLDRRNRTVWTIGDFLYRVTEPVLRPIRNFVPNFGGIDISPLIAILLLELLRQMLHRIAYAILIGSVQPLLF